MASATHGSRAVALAGPAGAGKTSLTEAMLFAAGAITRQGSVEAGNCVGDASPEARARAGSTEMNLARLTFLGDPFVIADLPGSPGFDADGYAALEACDMAVVVVDPDPARVGLAEPVLRRLDTLGIPHAIFVNKIDQARGRMRDIMEALQPLSAKPLIARQIPIRDGDRVTGYVDVAMERAFKYVPGKPSERIDIPGELLAREAEERTHLLETLSDHDDMLLEQLLSDEHPDLDTVTHDLAEEMQAGFVVPVLFGSAMQGSGIRRLLKMLRHETPEAAMAATRLGAESGVHVVKLANGGAVGRLAVARLFGAALAEGADLNLGDGETTRAGALFALNGDKAAKVQSAQPGDIIGIAKVENVRPGLFIGASGAEDRSILLTELPPRNATLAIAPKDRKDDVKLSTALHRLVEEDPALEWRQSEATHETLISGINADHLAVTLARLKRRFGVEVLTAPARIGYRESIRKSVTVRGRHKKQSGGHGQYGDVIIEVAPLPRGEGFRFNDRISGGVVPKQWIPAVEAGVRDALAKGPLGFPVVDVAVTLIDGSYHSVDSSEIAFRIAGRTAMADALSQAAPYLLEPVSHISVDVPQTATSKAGSVISSRRGQISGIGPHPSWLRWDRIEAQLPDSGLEGLDAELRSMSQGLAGYKAAFDHLAELSGKLADEVVRGQAEKLAA